jgi:MFS transporter, DHA2 family, multidrug resistance protein
VPPREFRDASGEYAPLHGSRLVLLTFAVATASFMEVLDMTIVNVSVPSISGSLAVSPSEGTWAISSYMLAAAVMQPLTGSISRRFGEVRTFVTSVLLFVVFSGLCGFATSMPMLVVARLIQGFVSGPMMSVAQALMMRNYPLDRRGLALGLWGMVVVIAPIVGPILGGWITDNWSWRWLFYINVPVGVLVALIAWTLLHRRESQKTKLPIDVVGLVLLIVGVGCLQFMLDNGNNDDWFSSAEIVIAAVASIVALAFFIPWELTDRHPVVDLHLFARRNFRVGTLIIGVAYFALSGINILFPLWLQTAAGYTSTWAGLAVAPVGVIALVMAPLLGKNMHRVNLRMAASFGFIVFALSTFSISAQNETAGFWELALPRLYQGLGIAFFFLPMNQIIMSSVGPADYASAAGVSNFIRTISGSISAAACIYFWNRRIDYHHTVLTEHIRVDSPAFTAYQAQLGGHGLSGTSALGYIDQVIAQQAMTLAVSDIFYLLGIVFTLLIAIVWLTKPPFSPPSDRRTGGPTVQPVEP